MVPAETLPAAAPSPHHGSSGQGPGHRIRPVSLRERLVPASLRHVAPRVMETSAAARGQVAPGAEPPAGVQLLLGPVGTHGD